MTPFARGFAVGAALALLAVLLLAFLAGHFDHTIAEARS